MILLGDFCGVCVCVCVCVVYLREFYEPEWKGETLQRGFVINQCVPSLRSLQINFPVWMFLIPPV